MKKNKKKLSIKFSPLVILFFGGIILTIGDIFAAKWIKLEGGIFLYLITTLFYIIGMVMLISSYDREDIPVASIILVMFNVVLLTIIGVIIFKEHMTATKITGIVLGLISVAFLEFGKKEIFFSK